MTVDELPVFAHLFGLHKPDVLGLSWVELQAHRKAAKALLNSK